MKHHKNSFRKIIYQKIMKKIILSVLFLVVLLNLLFIDPPNFTTDNQEPFVHSSPQPSGHKQPRKISKQQFHNVWLNSTYMGAIQANITSTGDAFDGYNLFVLEQTNRTDISKKKQSLFITSMQGEILAERPLLPLNTLSTDYFPAEFINSSTILLGEPEGVVLWNIYTNKTVPLDGLIGHHDYEFNPVNNTYFTFGGSDTVVINGTENMFGKILEINTTGQIIWSLAISSFIPPIQKCPFSHSIGNGTIDIVHPNTIFFDVEEDVLYFNARNTNTFYKIDHKTGKIIWGLGEYGDFTLFDRFGNSREELFYHAHAVEKVDNNTFILFDNDLHNQTDPNNKRSRILEITINETTMTANESWSWVAPPSYYSDYYGDADRLPNENRLGTFGTGQFWIYDVCARLVEVNKTGQIVWEMNLPLHSDYYYRIYRMERFRCSPILDSPSDRTTLSGDNVTIIWQTWYNFRTKMQMMGFYTVYLDNQIVNNGTHTYEKFYMPRNLTINLEALEEGDHNVTLVITDEAGHMTADSVNITSKRFIRTPADRSITL
ncbi:MAG: aryl-sulfate sulfotransferase, partial [Candidatus Hodarchaeota archaeon]